jgi:tRNA threonylcarbamoyl adenosine modification protein YeaZ
MRILAIDTALGACAAAVYDSEAGSIAAVESHAMARGHAEALMPLIVRVMDRAGTEFLELDRIAVTVGPGSFTGLRVGIAAARGIALAAGRPAVGVSTLAAYAAPHIAVDRADAVVVAIDARNAQVYFQLFGPGGRSLVSPRHVALGEALALEPVRALARSPYIAGSAAALVAAAWPAECPPPVAAEAKPAPDIEWVAKLGAVAQASLAPPKPAYLRPPGAQPQDRAGLPRQ